MVAPAKKGGQGPQARPSQQKLPRLQKRQSDQKPPSHPKCLGPQKRLGQLVVAAVLLTVWILFLTWMAMKD